MTTNTSATLARAMDTWSAQLADRETRLAFKLEATTDPDARDLLLRDLEILREDSRRFYSLFGANVTPGGAA